MLFYDNDLVKSASMGEVKHAIALGFEPKNIVYDSPVKTRTNLEIALKTGIYVNLDNVDEIKKVDELLKGSCRGNFSFCS